MQKYGVDYNISFSEQKPSTDTVAADMDNKPFRDADGKLLSVRVVTEHLLKTLMTWMPTLSL